MAVDSGMDLLSERARLMRESLQKSQTITDNVVSILGSFDSRLSALETAMRPTQIRTHAIRKAHENIDKTLKSAEVILSQFDLLRQAETKVLKGPHEDLESYLEAIAQLRKIIRYFMSNKSFKSSDGVLNHANSLLAKAQSKLEEEFKQLLASYSKAVEPDRLFDGLPNSLRPSSDGDGGGKPHGGHHNEDLEAASYTLPILIPSRVLPLLHDLAQQMVQAGHQQQLLQIYRETRSFVLEESLKKLGVEKLSKEDVQRMQWEVLEAKIGNWIHFMRIAVKLLFAGERQVCDQIFRGFDSLSDQSFAEVTVSSVSMLLSFGDAIARSKRSPEKLFVLLDMYEIMRELHTEIETIFKGKACLEIRDSAMGLTKRLAQTAQETFGDFEEAVEKDATKTAVLDGTVHPLTSYVINYVKFLFDYQSTLKQLFLEFGNGDDSNSQLASVTMRIMQALQTNLDGKSKQYKDPALTHLFLMNNIHYMVRSVRRSEAKDLLGDDWVQRHRRIVQQHANLYKRTAWTKILQSASAQGLTSSGGGSVEGGNSSGVSRGLLKERFKMFNMQFDELHQRQSQWTVPDTELRESLRLAVAEVLLPAYRSFLKRFGPLVESGKNSQKYIKYTAEDLERLLGELFEGGGSSGVMCSNEVKKIPKLFVIGDSYADTGNMEQTAVSWKSPYGLTFPGKPSGRYSDGLVPTDLLAKMLGAKPPYLQRTHGKSKRKPDRGMNFAYGESGIFSSPTTPSPNISEQAEFLNRRYLDHSLDKITPSDVAVLIYSGKDYFDFFTKTPSEDHIADTKEIVEKVMKRIMWSLRDFEALNFKKVGVTSLFPIGCLPRFTSASSFKSCNESLGEIVNLHNEVLKYQIDTKGYGHVIIDFHGAFMKVLKNKGSKTRFKTPLKPCCEGDCGRVDDKGAKKYRVCEDPKSTFFWDDIDPTQQGWKSIFSELGNPFTKKNKF